MHAKHVRKRVSLLLAAVLSLSSAIPSYATETGTIATGSEQQEELEDGNETETKEAQEEHSEATVEDATEQEGENQVPEGDYFVFVQGSPNATISVDESRLFEEELDGYKVLVYDEGDDVSMGADVADGYQMVAYNDSAELLESVYEDGNFSFTMPDSDVLLMVVEQGDKAKSDDVIASNFLPKEDETEEESEQTEEATEPGQTEEVTEPSTEKETETEVSTDVEESTEESTEAAEVTEKETEISEEVTEATSEEETETNVLEVPQTQGETVDVDITTSDDQENIVQVDEIQDATTDGYPVSGSAVIIGTYQVWQKDTDFAYQTFTIYNDSNVEQSYVSGEIDFSTLGTSNVLYKFSLKDDPTRYWEGIVEYEVIDDRDMVTAASDSIDNIIDMAKITPDGEYDNVIPKRTDEVVSGPDYTVKEGNTSFDLRKMNAGYNPETFNVSLSDDGGFDVNVPGDYTVSYVVSSKFYAQYEWKVTCVVHVVEEQDASVSVYVCTPSIEVSAFDEEGASLGSIKDGQTIFSDEIKSLEVKAIGGEEISPKLILRENGAESDETGWNSESEEDGTFIYSLSLSESDASYEIFVTDTAYEAKLAQKAKVSSGWLSSELANQILYIDGTKATLKDGNVIDINDPDEVIYDGYDEDMTGEEEIDLASDVLSPLSLMSADSSIMLAANSNTKVKVMSKSFSVGYFYGTESCDNYGWQSTFTGWTKGTVTPTAKGFNTINQWLKDSSCPISLDDKTRTNLQVTVSCSNPNGSKMGLPSRTRSGVKMTVTVYQKGDAYSLKVTSSLTHASDGQGNYQTLSGSKTLKATISTVKVNIKKTINDASLVTGNPRINLNTTFTIYDDSACAAGDIVEVVRFSTTNLGTTSMTQQVELDADETYWMKETGRVAGCRKDNTTYKFTTSATGADTNLQIVNYEYTYPGVILKKVDSETNKGLANAIYEVKFYSRNPNTESSRSDYKLLGTFYMKTDANGEIKYDKSHYLSSWNGHNSSALLVNASGTPTLTLGWLTFKEVQAPAKYDLNSTMVGPIALAEPSNTAAQNLTYSIPTAKNNPSLFSVQVKKDMDSSAYNNSHYSVEGTQYTLYSDSALTKVVKVFTIKSDGTSDAYTRCEAGATYYLKETKAGLNLKLDEKVYTITGASGAKVVKAFTDDIETGSLLLEKYIEEGTVNDGTEELPGEGIEFQLSWQEGTLREPTLVTNEDGKASRTNLVYGTYTVTEVPTGDKYHILAEPITFTIDEDHQNINLTKELGLQIDNKFVKPRTLVVEKRDSETGALTVGRGGKFQILDETGTAIKLLLKNTAEKTDIFTLGDDGKIIFADDCGILGGKYTLVEVEAPKGYTKAVDVPFEVTQEDQEVLVSVTMKDTAIKGHITVEKFDKETGEACGAGFTFQVISVGDKVDPEGNVYDGFSDGSVVATITTGDDGVAVTDDILYFGKYLVKEVATGEGYAISNVTHEVEIKSDGQVPEGVINADVRAENVQTELQILKQDSVSGKALQGITFRIKPERAADDDSQLYVTDASGKIVVKGLKHSSTYTVQEVETIPGYNLDETIHKFGVDDTGLVYDVEDDETAVSRQITDETGAVGTEKGILYEYVLNNQPNELHITKIDAETGIKLSDAKMKLERILDEGSEVIDEWVSTKEVHVLYALAAGKYRLTEVAAPETYEVADPIEFTLTNSLSPQEVVMKDIAIKGHITVAKFDQNTDKACGAGFTFQVISIGDKVDPEGNIYDGFADGSVVATITTGDDGVAVTDDILYFGKYLVKEVATGEGYAISNVTHEVEIKSDGQVPEGVINADVRAENVQTELQILKQDSVSGKALQGITFRIKPERAADDDSQLYVTDASGKIVVKGLKHSSTYTVQEVETIPGYNLDETIHKFGVDDTGLVYDVEDDETAVSRQITDETGTVGAEKGILYEYVLDNQPNELQVTKTDVTTGEELAGAKMILTRISDESSEEDSEVIEEWISTDEAHVIYGLAAGTYRLTEVTAPEKYEVAESIVFTLVDSLEAQKVVMSDAPYRDVEVSKVSITDNEEMAGAHLQILDAENKLVEEWISGDDGIGEDGKVIPHIVALHSGVYTLKEAKPADGYVTAASIVFTVEARDEFGDAEVQKVQMVDDITKIDISKKDITTNEEVPGAHLQIKDKDGNIVEEWTSTEEPHYIEMLPIGTYTLTETQPPTQYELAATITFEVKDTGEVQHFEMFDSPYREIVVSKLDLTGENEIAGAHLQIQDADGNVVDEWISGEETQVETEDQNTSTASSGVNTEEGSSESKGIAAWIGETVFGITSGTEATYQHKVKLPSGTYTLVETKPADGYVTADPIDFTVVQTSATDFDAQTVQMFDDVTKVEISKQDVNTEKELPGAKLQIKDSEDKVVEEWTSTSEAHYIEMLPIGKYTLVETSAPNGYEVSDPVSFEIKDTGEVQHVTMYDAPSPQGTSTPQTGDAFPAAQAAVVAGAIVAILAVAFVLLKRRKK